MTAAALAITGGIVGAAGSMMQGLQQHENADAQAEAERTRARIAERNERIIAQQGAVREDIMRRRQREVISRQRTGLAESGIDIEVGSPADVIDQSEIEAELEIMTSRYQDELQRRNLQLEAKLARNQASRYRRAGDKALASGFIGAGASALGGFAQARGFGSGTLDPDFRIVLNPRTRPTRISRRGGIGGV